MIFSIIPFNGETGERFRFRVNFTKDYGIFTRTKASRIIELEKFTRFPYNSYVLVLEVTPLFSLEKFGILPATYNSVMRGKTKGEVMNINEAELYAERANRDARYKELKANGARGLRRSTSRNQLLHPMYVEDRKAGLSDADRGFGNTIYKTHFSILYRVEWYRD